jgi:hypothetical protein
VEAQVSKRKRLPGYDGKAADTTLIQLNVNRIISRCWGWDELRFGVFMRVVIASFKDQKRVPDTAAEILADEHFFRAMNLNPRRLRKFYDLEMAELVREVVPRRVPLVDGERERIFHASKGLCFHCNGPITQKSFHVDHYHPVAAQGMTTRENLVASCAPCNMAKGARVVS